MPSFSVCFLPCNANTSIAVAEGFLIVLGPGQTWRSDKCEATDRASTVMPRSIIYHAVQEMVHLTLLEENGLIPCPRAER